MTDQQRKYIVGRLNAAHNDLKQDLQGQSRREEHDSLWLVVHALNYAHRSDTEILLDRIEAELDGYEVINGSIYTSDNAARKRMLDANEDARLASVARKQEALADTYQFAMDLLHLGGDALVDATIDLPDQLIEVLKQVVRDA